MIARHRFQIDSHVSIWNPCTWQPPKKCPSSDVLLGRASSWISASPLAWVFLTATPETPTELHWNILKPIWSRSDIVKRTRVFLGTSTVRSINTAINVNPCTILWYPMPSTTASLGRWISHDPYSPEIQVERSGPVHILSSGQGQFTLAKVKATTLCKLVCNEEPPTQSNQNCNQTCCKQKNKSLDLWGFSRHPSASLSKWHP